MAFVAVPFYSLFILNYMAFVAVPIFSGGRTTAIALLEAVAPKRLNSVSGTRSEQPSKTPGQMRHYNSLPHINALDLADTNSGVALLSSQMHPIRVAIYQYLK